MPSHTVDLTDLYEYLQKINAQYTEGLNAINNIIVTLSSSMIFGIFFVLYRNSDDNFKIIITCLKLTGNVAFLVIISYVFSYMFFLYGMRRSKEINEKYYKTLEDKSRDINYDDANLYNPTEQLEKIKKYFTIAKCFHFLMVFFFICTTFLFIYMINIFST